MYGAKTIVNRRVLLIVCPKRSLQHCLMGQFELINPVLFVVSGVANWFHLEGMKCYYIPGGGGGGRRVLPSNDHMGMSAHRQWFLGRFGLKWGIHFT